MTTIEASQRVSPAGRTRDLTTAALVAALISASAWISLPLGAVPVTLQVFFVVLAALLLRPAWAGASMGVYVALGAAGLPVFAGGRGGFEVLAGPTGGYLIGFVAAALMGAALRLLLVSRRVPQGIADAGASLLVIIVVYLLGAVQLAIVLALTPGAAFAAGVVPFVVPDLVKALIAIGVAASVRRALRA